MPYTNVPKPLWGKMDRCVENVMRREGVDKKRAIAICHESVVKNEEADMATKRQQRKMRQKMALREVAEDPQADIVAEAFTPEEAQVIAEKAMAAEKELVEVQIYRPYDGASSWEELDAYLAAREIVWATREVTDQLNSLIQNVLDSDDVEDKGAAITKLASGFNKRVRDAQEEEEKEKGLCECGCEEEDPVTISGILRRVFGKAPMTGASRNDLPDSAFAYIEPGGKKDDGGKTVPRSLRHYPINDAAHVRNALARAGAAIKKGGKTAEIARRAMAKIRAAARKLGIGTSANEGKSAFYVTKSEAGNYRWFGWVSNKWRDNDVGSAPEKGGEIISEEAHKEYVAWLDAHPEMGPESWVWHTPGTARKSRADWWDYAHGQLMMSGPLTPEEGEAALKAYDGIDAGMSHGFLVFDRDKADATVISSYRSFEASDLPLEYAANPWTDYESIRKEADEMGFNIEKRTHLVALLGEEKVAELESATSDREKALLEAQIEFKAKAAAVVATPVAEPVLPLKEAIPKPAPVLEATPKPDDVAKSLGLSELDAFLRKVLATQDAQGKMIVEMKAIVDKVAKSDVEKIAEQFVPRVADAGFIWKLRPSTSEQTALKEGDDTVPDKGPSVQPAPEGLGWIREQLARIEMQ